MKMHYRLNRPFHGHRLKRPLGLKTPDHEKGPCMATLISAGIVVTANEGMDVWQPGYVVVANGRIAEAGPGLGPPGDFNERIEVPASILMPGLVNAHAHSPSALV